MKIKNFYFFQILYIAQILLLKIYLNIVDDYLNNI